MSSRPRLSSRWLRPAAVLLLVVLALVAAASGAGPGVRVVLLLLFLVAGPGLALVGLLGIAEPWRELSLVIGVSLAIDLVVVSTLAYAGQRAASDALALLIGIAVVGAGVQVAMPALQRRWGRGSR